MVEANSVWLPAAPKVRREAAGRDPRSIARILDVGPGGLIDSELLALLLGSQADLRAREIADALLQRFGSLNGMGRAHIAELRDALGSASRRAAVLAAAFEVGRRSLTPSERPRLNNSGDVDEFYRPRIAHLQSEALHVACVDLRHGLIRDVRVSAGGVTACTVLPREVFAPALREGASGIILVHNHPSGSLQPSAEDIRLTRRMVQVGRLLGVQVLDHVIIGATGHFSVAATGGL